jgi:hypothetical protein
MTYQGSWHVGPYPVYLVLGGIPLMAQPLIDWLQMGEMTSGAEGIFLRGGNGQHGGSHRTYWQPYAPFRGRLCFLILICSHTAGSYCRGTPLPSGDPPSVAHNGKTWQLAASSCKLEKKSKIHYSTPYMLVYQHVNFEVLMMSC